MTTLPKALRARLDRELPSALELLAESVSDKGTTIKWLWGLEGGARVETVLMLYPDRATVCVSSQAGCAMGCGFCATGQAGFERHLTTGEIVEQVVRATQRARATGRRVSNVVFMGMGEPLANYDRTWQSVERMHDDLGLSARHLTVSTVGHHAGHPPPRRRTAAGEPGRVAPRRERRAAQRARARSTAAIPSTKWSPRAECRSRRTTAACRSSGR